MASQADSLGWKGTLPPRDIGAEMALIGSVCLSPYIIDELADVKVEHFYDDRHQRIWKAIHFIAAANSQPDAVTLATDLNNQGALEAIGGVEYLTQVLSSVPNSSHARFYADIVLSKWRSRQAKYGCSEVVQLIEDGGTDDDVATKAESVLAAIAERTNPAGDVAIGDVMLEAWGEIKGRLDRKEAAGTPTGFVNLDKMIVGIQPTELVILAARPAIGKSAFAGCMAYSLAKRGIPVLFLSLEMSRLEIVERLLCLDSGTSGAKLKAGQLNEIEIDALLVASGRLGAMPIRIDERPGQRVRAIASTARRAKRIHGVRFVFVDYLQLIEPDKSKDVREQEVASITKALKGLAKELEIPFIVLAQLNRAVESRENKQPKLGDLRESGAIEQDADKVFFLHRPCAYDPNDRPGECDLIVAKNRCGKTGPVTLAWIPDNTAFRDLESREWQQAEAASTIFNPPTWVG